MAQPAASSVSTVQMPTAIAGKTWVESWVPERMSGSGDLRSFSDGNWRSLAANGSWAAMMTLTLAVPSRAPMRDGAMMASMTTGSAPGASGVTLTVTTL